MSAKEGKSAKVGGINTIYRDAVATTEHGDLSCWLNINRRYRTEVSRGLLVGFEG